ncbi:hypothetical protein Bca4012_094569 [Brassica carinata]
MTKSHLCFLFSSLNFTASQTSVDAPTMQALKSSLNLTKDVDWSNPNPCKWPTVQCDASNKVTRIQLKTKGIRGTLPQKLQNPHRADGPGAFPEPNLGSDPQSLRFNPVTDPEPPRQPLRLCPQEAYLRTTLSLHGR